jgi:hypothetical protein
LKAENMLKGFNGRNSEFSNTYHFGNAGLSLPEFHDEATEHHNNFALSKRFNERAMMTSTLSQVATH